MKFPVILFLFAAISPSALIIAQPSNRQMMPPADIGIGDLVPEDLPVHTPEGVPTTIRNIAKGKYTVLVTGCLTCPIFHRTYPSTEAIFADYRDREDIQFYFLYKSLAHPELNGYVQPVTLDERLKHIEEAKRVLGTTIPWLCDGPDNAVRKAFNLGPNSEMILSPEGELIHATRWTDSKGLRSKIEELVGESETFTMESELSLERENPHRRQRSYESTVLPKPMFSSELVPVVIRPIHSSKELFYVKPRMEVEQRVLRDGSGEMYLGFFPDPIHGVHWNNLVDPVKYELKLSDGTVISPRVGEAPTVERESDGDPREFKLNVMALGDERTAELVFHYYACSVEEGWCKPVSQTYEILFVRDRDGGGTNGRSFRFAGSPSGNQRNPSMQRQQRQGMSSQNRARTVQPQQIRQRLLTADADKDGKITREELPQQMRQRFQQMDLNDDGHITMKEIDEMLQRRFGEGGSRRPGGR